MGVALQLILHNMLMLFSIFYIKCDMEIINHKVKVCDNYKYLANFCMSQLSLFADPYNHVTTLKPSL